jgi:glutamate synthase (NADPH/NADH) small chain
MNPSSSPSGKAKYAWSEIDRAEPPKRPAADRVSDFRQAAVPYDEATAREQASRCIQCPNPACVEACPLDCPIPELLLLTADGQFKEAAGLLFTSHHIPEIASHACVGGRVCERACILAGKSEAVPIRAITRFLLDYGWKHGLAEPAVEHAKDQSVAVIGSGIGGLVTADALSRKGYAVTVFDSREKPGGRVMNGLPGFRMDKELVERRLGLLKQRGIRFQMGVTFGRDVKLSDLRREYDAVFLGFGLADALPLGVPGAELRGVYQAFPFVIQNAQPACGPMPDRSGPVAGAKTDQPIVDVRGKRVVVLGGGDTAMDVLRIAIRRGAADALCLYRRDEASVPADAEEYANAREEGARFLFLSQPVAVLGNAAGGVTHVRCLRMELAGPDGAGRPAVKPVAGSEFNIPADAVFVAYGFTAPRLPDSDDFARLSVDGRGCLQVDANRMTNFPGVFAGGSIVRGPAPLVEVVRDARRAAAAIDSHLAARRGQ